MLEVNYVGNLGRKLYSLAEYNPAIFGPGATTRNTDARRRFAPNYASIGELSSSYNSEYNGLQVQLNKRFGVVRVDQPSNLTAEELVGPVAEDPFDRRALVADHAVGVENRDDVRGIVDKRA